MLLLVGGCILLVMGVFVQGQERGAGLAARGRKGEQRRGGRAAHTATAPAAFGAQ